MYKNTTTVKKANSWDSEAIISSYSRADAIEDGFLIQIDEKMSQEAGFKFPIAISRDVWEKYVYWTDEDTKRQTYQDLKGRLWDVLCMLMFAIRRSRNVNERLRFSFSVVPRGLKSRAKTAKLIHLWAHIHPGDQLEPVITISDKENLD